MLTGAGAGKTTSAIGKIIRALGHGSRVLIVQFFKNDENEGMYRQLTEFKNGDCVEFVQYGVRCLNPEAKEARECMACGECMKDKKLLRRRVLNAIKKVRNSMGERDSIVLDEILVAYSLGYISKEEILSLINEAPDKEWYLTGRLFYKDVGGRVHESRIIPDWLYELGDYIMIVEQVKHPFNKGVKARRGVEF